MPARLASGNHPLTSLRPPGDMAGKKANNLEAPYSSLSRHWLSVFAKEIHIHINHPQKYKNENDIPLA
jgi:hypothetical protein